MFEENSEPGVSEQDRIIDTRFSTLGGSVTRLPQTLQVLTQQQLAPYSSSSVQPGLGMKTSFSPTASSVQTVSSTKGPNHKSVSFGVYFGF